MIYIVLSSAYNLSRRYSKIACWTFCAVSPVWPENVKQTVIIITKGSFNDLKKNEKSFISKANATTKIYLLKKIVFAKQVTISGEAFVI